MPHHRFLQIIALLALATGLPAVSTAQVNSGNLTVSSSIYATSNDDVFLNQSGAVLTLTNGAGFYGTSSGYEGATLNNAAGASVVVDGPYSTQIDFRLNNAGQISVRGNGFLNLPNVVQGGTVNLETGSHLNLQVNQIERDIDMAVNGRLNFTVGNGSELTLRGTHIIGGTNSTIADGTVNLTESATMENSIYAGANTAVLNNESGNTLTLTDGAGFYGTSAGYDGATLNNAAGASVVIAGPYSTQIDFRLNNAGQINVSGNGFLNLPNVVQGGTVNLETGSHLNLQVNQIERDIDMAVNGRLNFTVGNGSELTLRGTHIIGGTNSTIADGTVNLTESATMENSIYAGANTAVLNNENGNTLTLTNGAGFYGTSAGYDGATLNNAAGASVVIAGPYSTQIDFRLNNAGQINVSGNGFLNLPNVVQGGTVNLETGSHLNLQVNQIERDIDMTVNGRLNFTVGNGSELTLRGTPVIGGTNHSVIADGTVNLTESATLENSLYAGANTAVLNNETGNTLTLTNGAGFYGTSAGYAGATLNNAVGASVVVAGSAYSTQIDFRLENAGQILVSGGSYVSVGNELDNQGRILIEVGSTLVATSGTFVLNGGTLAGDGLLASDLTLMSGATLAPGAIGQAGSLTIGDATFAGGSTLSLSLSANPTLGLAGTDWDQLVMNGVLDLSALTAGNPFYLDVSLIGGMLSGYEEGATFVWDSVVTASGGITGFSADNFEFVTSQGGLEWALSGFSVELQDSQLNIAYSGSAIPEPSTYAAAAGLVALGLAFIRRRQRSKTA